MEYQPCFKFVIYMKHSIFIYNLILMLAVIWIVGMSVVSCRNAVQKTDSAFKIEEGPVSQQEKEVKRAAERSEEEVRDSLLKIYDEVQDGNFCYWYEVRKGDKWGVISRQGEELVPCRYESLECWETLHLGFPYYEVKENGLVGVWDVNEKVMITPCLYDEVCMSAWDCHYMKVCKDGKWGLHHGKVYVEPQYDEVQDSYADEETFFVRKGDKVGVIDTTGTWLLEAKYDDFDYARVDCYPFKRDGKWGVVDKHGKVVLPFKYDGLVSGCCGWSCYCMILCQDGKWGVFDVKRRKLYPFVFDDAEFYDDPSVYTGLVYRWFNLKKDSVIYQLYDMRADGKMEVKDGDRVAYFSYPK